MIGLMLNRLAPVPAPSGGRKGAVSPHQTRSETENAAENYVLALERWQRLGAQDIDALVEDAITGLGLPAELIHQEMLSLSGGQVAKVALAGIELSRFDITLLDEPTNDLDFLGPEYLERLVKQTPGGIIIVSHDRAFLESTVDSVLELDEHDHRARLYRGGWLSYYDERATVRRHAEQAYTDYAANRQVLLERARRERQGGDSRYLEREEAPPGPRQGPARRPHQSHRAAGGPGQTYRAGACLPRAGREALGRDGTCVFPSPRLLERAPWLLAWMPRSLGNFRLGPIELEIAWGERVALSGPNGAGKTTVIDALLGRLLLQMGARWLGPSVVVGELGQRRSAYVQPAALLSGFMRATGLDIAAARSLLVRDRGRPRHAPVDSLSPGERTRAELAGFQARGVNFLVLDEPTNHLDLLAIEELEEALSSYNGTLVVASHDRRFLESLRSREITIRDLACRLR
jgi:ATPase subunit of ABC transporter with duplicated ATPase domains